MSFTIYMHCCFIHLEVSAHKFCYEDFKLFSYHLQIGSYFSEHTTNVVCGLRLRFFRFWLKHLSGNLRRDEKLMGSIFTTWEIFSKQLNIHIWSSKIRWAKNKYLGFMNKWWELKPRKYWRLFRWAIQKRHEKSLETINTLKKNNSVFNAKPEKSKNFFFFFIEWLLFKACSMKLYHLLPFILSSFSLYKSYSTDPYTQTQIS